MGKEPSTIYHVGHSNIRSVELVISDSAMRYANTGKENYRQMISIAFRNRIKEKEGQDPGWIEFDDLEFDVIRTVRAAKPEFLGCGCECAGCDQGYHCHKQNRSCNM